MKLSPSFDVCAMRSHEIPACACPVPCKADDSDEDAADASIPGLVRATVGWRRSQSHANIRAYGASDRLSGGANPDGSDRKSVPILMYHQVTPTPHASFTKYAITPGRFASQMRWLAMTGHRSISLDAFVAYRAGLGSLPTRPVVITFDDGFQDTIDYGVPVLRRYGFTATFYVVAGLIGDRSRWLETERGVSLPLFDWPAARQLQSDGFTVSSHALTHARLDLVDAAGLGRELGESRRLLEDGLGVEVRDLAYPYGLYDQRVIEAAQEAGYRSACSVRIGRSAPDDEMMALHRVPIDGHDALPTFVLRLRTGFGFAESVRRVASRDAMWRIAR